MCFHDWRCLKDSECDGAKCVDGKVSSKKFKLELNHESAKSPRQSLLHRSQPQKSLAMPVVVTAIAIRILESVFVIRCGLEILAKRIFVSYARTCMYYTFDVALRFRNLTNYTAWRDLLHPRVFKEYAILSGIVIGCTALVTCIAFGILRARRKDLVTSYMMEEDEDHELVKLSSESSKSEESLSSTLD